MSIPNKAVEAAKKVAFERYGSKPDTAYLRTILEAAAPHLLATAWDEGADNEFRRSVLKQQHGTNPYRSQA